MLSDHSEIKLAINNRTIAGKSPNIWRLNNKLLNNIWVKEDVSTQKRLGLWRGVAQWQSIFPAGMGSVLSTAKDILRKVKMKEHNLPKYIGCSKNRASREICSIEYTY